MSAFIQHIGRHLLSYSLIPLALIAGIFSYHRFIVEADYIVEYEGDCDPVEQSCFIGCEDDECTEVYPHSWIQKRAANLKEQCGVDVTDCENAGVCEPGEECQVRFCDSSVEECIGPGAEEFLEEEEEEEVEIEEEDSEEISVT